MLAMTNISPVTAEWMGVAAWLEVEDGAAVGLSLYRDLLAGSVIYSCLCRTWTGRGSLLSHCIE